MTWSAETLQAFYEKVRRETGIYIPVEIVETTGENQSPVAIKLPNYIFFSPHLFNNTIYSDDMKVMMALLVYSEIYIRVNKKVGNISVNTEALAKGLCDKLGTQYISIREINLLSKQIGVLPFSTFDCSSPKDYYNNKIDLRRNLFILSGPSGCGKTTVFHELKKRMPEVQRAITVTTRNPRGKELHGVDYYFCSDEDFLAMIGNNQLAEYTIYDISYYGTPFSEIEKHSEEQPVFLIIDAKGKRSIVNGHYPLATSVFLMPPSVEEAMRRLASRNENSYDEIERRCRKMESEIRESAFYDYIVENDDLAKCVDTICSIIEKTLQQ